MTYGPLNIASAIEDHFAYLAALPPQAREGLHVSDITGPRGWSCPRYVQLVMSQAGHNAVASYNHQLKRLKYGDGLHHMTYRHVEDALVRWGAMAGYQIDAVIIEESIQDDETGMVGTPDIVAHYTLPDGSQRIQVIDIKSIDPGEWLRKQTKKGLSPATAYKRQVLTYSDLLGEQHGVGIEASFLFIRTDKPYLYSQVFIQPTGRILPMIREHLANLEALLAQGVYAETTKAKSHCAECPMSEACAIADRHMQREGTP